MKVKLSSLMYIASVIGLAISIYLTAYHYAGIPLACSTTGLINCESVLNNPLSNLFGIPIALFGIPFFIIEIALIYIKKIDPLVIWNLIGVGMVVFFIYLEYVIGNICIWCTGVHILTALLFFGSVYKLIKGGEL